MIKFPSKQKNSLLIGKKTADNCCKETSDMKSQWMSFVEQLDQLSAIFIKSTYKIEIL